MRSAEEVAERARLMADGVLHPDMADWTGWNEREVENACVLGIYLLRQRKANGPQRRALRLFRSWLTPPELEEYRRRRHVTVRGTAGGRYRIRPSAGLTQRVERHGSRDFAKVTFCLHPDHWVPPADVALGHYLTIQTDEPAFIEAANEHRTNLWDGAYLRRLNQARRRRRATIEGGV